MARKPAKPAERGGDAARRAEILDAAEKLFRHYGPQKTTIGDIAREAGIGVGSVYLEFCSKEDIVAELSARRHDRVLGAMRVAVEGKRGALRLSAALEARVSALFELKSEGAHSCDLVLCSVTKRSYARFRDEERALVARELAELGAADPERASLLVERAFATLSPPWLFELERGAALGLCRDLAQLLLQGLLDRPGAKPMRRRSG